MPRKKRDDIGHPVFILGNGPNARRDLDSQVGQVRIDASTIYHNNVFIIHLLEEKGEGDMDSTLRDSVCGMDVTYETAQARSEYDGQTYYFCSIDCKEAFDRAPETYIAQEEDLPR